MFAVCVAVFATASVGNQDESDALLSERVSDEEDVMLQHHHIAIQPNHANLSTLAIDWSQPPEYILYTEPKRCSDLDGYETIMDERECLAASIAVGKSTGQVKVRNYQRQCGCTWHPSGPIELWTEPRCSKTQACTEWNYGGCLCKRKGEKTPETNGGVVAYIPDSELLPKIAEVLDGMKDEFKGEDGKDGVDGEVGRKGDKGEVGAKGDKGDSGDDGTHGNHGKDGKKGEKGDSGADGTHGNHGKDGKKGEKGDSGADGTHGNHGKDGKQGEKGNSGVDGTHGNHGKDGKKGEKGNSGADGAHGNHGNDGEQGEKGDSGEDGTDGNHGRNGENGQNGVKGEKGEKGEIGQKGEKGDSGADGAHGNHGNDGEQGEKGDSGEDGTDGNHGRNGEKGQKGDKGEKGEKGETTTTKGLSVAVTPQGQATLQATNMNLCSQGTSSVHCPQQCTSRCRGIELPLDVGQDDFRFQLTFSLDRVAATAASVQFSSGENIGLDGGGNTLFLEGGSWGGPKIYGAAPTAGRVHTLVVSRTRGSLSITLDGQSPYPRKSMTAGITSVKVRPWRNKMDIFDFRQLPAV